MASPSEFAWHPIPSSPTNSTCKVHLLQAGGLDIPYDLVLLPQSNDPNASASTIEQDETENPENTRRYYAPDYCFLIEHTPSNSTYVFDLGMRKDLENLPPTLVKTVLPNFPTYPKSPAELLKKHGTPSQQPENVKAVMFSHVHFDHVGDGAKAGFTNAELWVGPTCCTYAKPGYPVDKDGVVLTDNLPTDGSRKVVEAHISDERLAGDGDPRVGRVKKGQEEGKYTGITLRKPKWFNIGAFPRGFDLFEDGSAYLIDAPGHSSGHQMLLVRVTSGVSDGDTFVLLAGDCYHHPALLKDPERTARPPYSKGSMHGEPDQAIDTMKRTRQFAQNENVWVCGGHDFDVGEKIAPGEKEIHGLVQLDGWKEKGWNN